MDMKTNKLIIGLLAVAATHWFLVRNLVQM